MTASIFIGSLANPAFSGEKYDSHFTSPNLFIGDAATNVSNIDGFVKNLKTSFGVIPAKAEIMCFQIFLDTFSRRHDHIFTSI